jgi:hypothetical protein
LHQNIQHSPVLIHRPPEVVRFAVDRDEDLIQMPFVAGLRTAPPELVRVWLPER